MKEILIILTFVFYSLFSFADNVGIETALKGTEVDLNFNVKLMMGLIKAENNPKYKKLLDYIDENLDKKGEVRYSTKINFKNLRLYCNLIHNNLIFLCYNIKVKINLI